MFFFALVHPVKLSHLSTLSVDPYVGNTCKVGRSDNMGKGRSFCFVCLGWYIVMCYVYVSVQAFV